MHSITRLYNNFFVILIKEGKEIEEIARISIVYTYYIFTYNAFRYS